MSVVVSLLLLQSALDKAQALLRDGKIEEAQQAVQSELKLSPSSVPALTLQGRIAMAQSDFDLARSSFQRAAELAPESASAQFMLGFFHYVDNDFARAKPALERARKLLPDDPRTALFLALTYEGLAQPQAAEGLFKEALRRPTVEALVAYGRMLFTEGRFEEAQAQITKALSLNPNSREALYEQARIDFERGKFEDCVARAEKALLREGDGVTPRQIHFLLSRAYSKVGNIERASEHRRQFEAIPPRLIR